MHDLLVAAAFLAMLLAPCIVVSRSSAANADENA